MAGSVNMMMAGMGDQKRRNEAAAAGSHHHLYIAAGHGGTGTPSGSSCGVVTSTKRAKTGRGAAETVPPVSSSSTRPSPSSSSSLAREKKDKIGERVSALQQLVSPYGKVPPHRHTASVLQGATCYIKFLHDQVQKMSAPFLHAPPIHSSQGYSLRSRGLCLVPVECTATIASTNGADIWAPTNTTTSSSDGSAYGYRF